MALLPNLPALPDLREAAARPVRPLLAVAPDYSPSGTGWGFVPDQGWGWDAGGYSASYGSGFTIGGGAGGGSVPGGGGGFPEICLGTWCVGGGGMTTNVPVPGSGSGGSGGGGATSIPGKIVAAATGAVSTALGIPAINWGRLAAFLLGLLLIGGGLYLLKPVQEVINRSVKGAAEGLAA